MSQIGTLVGGAGANTIIAGLAQLDQYIVIGDVDTANPLQGLTIEIDGKTYFSIANNAALITAWMKYLMETINGSGVVGLQIKVATGKVQRKSTIRLQNAGATTPNIFAYSEAPDGIPYVGSTLQINAQSYQDFDNFAVLMIDTPANVDHATIQFRNGEVSDLTAVEIDALFAMYNQSEANGRLGGVSIIDNQRATISNVRIYTNNVGAVNVLIGKIPQEAFDIIKAASQR